MILSKLNYYLRGLYQEVVEFKKYGKDAIPVNYYSLNNNWGDQVNVYLLEKITNKKVRKIQSKVFNHLLCVGSVLSTSNKKSIVWGSGFISQNAILKSTELDIRAVRGYLTYKRLRDEYEIVAPQVFGDPVVLIRDFYNPKIEKKYKIGIIPHYEDKDSPIVDHYKKLGCKYIDIQNDIEAFIDEVMSCEFILSSSLHGLIVADSYSIPNVRCVFSPKVVGGDFKFLDYYSTTNNNNPIVLGKNDLEMFDLDFIMSKCKVSDFTESKSALLESFPNLELL